jgi:hypothetical protein
MAQAVEHLLDVQVWGVELNALYHKKKKKEKETLKLIEIGQAQKRQYYTILLLWGT